MIGQRLGSYEITANLGEGGMGEVWRAHDSKLWRDVAIRVLPAAFTEDKERLARPEPEAERRAPVHPPHTASIFGLEESGGMRSLVLELVEGPALAARLDSGGLPWSEEPPWKEEWGASTWDRPSRGRRSLLGIRSKIV